MEIIANVYDKTLENIGYLDGASELVRYYRYRNPGSFSMRIPATSTDVGLMLAGFIIVFSDDPTVGYLIESVEPSQDLPNVAEISGRDLRALFDFRIIPKLQSVNGTMWNRMYWLIYHNATHPTDANRVLPFVQDLVHDGDDSGESGSQQFTGKNLLEAIVDTLGTGAYGWRMDLDLEAKTLTPIFYSSTDRSTDVFFDDLLGTMNKCGYVRDVSGYRTVATIAGEGEGTARKYTGIDITGTASGTYAGFDRRELFVDANDIRSEIEDESGNKTTISSAEYTKLLQQRGLEKLRENSVEISLEPKVNDDIYAFGADYGLGDIVSYANHNQISIAGTARVVSVQVDGVGVEKTATPEFEILTMEAK